MDQLVNVLLAIDKAHTSPPRALSDNTVLSVHAMHTGPD